MAAVAGILNQSLTVDDIGHREYKVDYLVYVDNPGLDGATIAYNIPGLPTVGSTYSVGNDNDPWAFCKWDTTVSKHVVSDGEPGKYWKVGKTFSTKPFKLCNEISIENPLLQPPKISGSYNKITREESFDRFGNVIKNSAHELLRGPQVEFDRYDLTINIEMNVPLLQAPLVASLINKLNSTTMWGFPPRRIKFSKFDFDEVYWGVCNKYYTWKMGFEIPSIGFDRVLLDEGTKVLNGSFNITTGYYKISPVEGVVTTPNPDPLNPTHFNRYQDRYGNKTNVILNGAGLPAEVYIDGARTTTLMVDGGSSITNITDINTNYDYVVPQDGQPTDPTDPIELLVEITDPTDSITRLKVVLTGRIYAELSSGEAAAYVEFTESLNIVPTRNTTTIVRTVNKYSFLDRVSIPTVVGDSGNEIIEIYANDKVTAIGSVYVEYYDQANLLQLGIPATIGP